MNYFKKVFRKNVWWLLLLLILTILFVFWFSSTNCELRLVKFQVTGKVFDQITRQPLRGVEVLLVLREYIVEDEDETEKRFLWQKVQRGGVEDSSNDDYPHGLTDKEGVYTATAHRKYSTHYYGFLSLLSPRNHPFKTAWITFKKKGYKQHTLKVATNDWTNTGFNNTGQYDAITDIYIHPTKDEK